jgi:selenide,water dikinase
VCEGSGCSAELDYAKVPLIKNLGHYLSKMIYPDNTMRNWQSYDKKVNGIGAESLLTLCDPQTSGGLLVTISKAKSTDFEKFCGAKGLNIGPIGRIVKKNEHVVTIF